MPSQLMPSQLLQAKKTKLLPKKQKKTKRLMPSQLPKQKPRLMPSQLPKQKLRLMPSQLLSN
jgi:hypothetical protein